MFSETDTELTPKSSKTGVRKKVATTAKKATGSKATTKPASRAVPKSTTFESALSELETIVQQLETGEQPLEESLSQFERGVSLARFCKQNLDEANQKVKILIDSGDTSDRGYNDLEDFDSEAS